MKRMVRCPAITWMLILASLGAAPSATSYLEVERRIAKVVDPWSQEGAKPERNTESWKSFLDALRGALKSYAVASNEDERLRALGRLHRFSEALKGISWPPAGEIREELRAWLRPRVRLAWAERRIAESIKKMPQTDAPAVLKNRERWVRFVEDDLGSALRAYEAANLATAQLAAVKRVSAALKSIEDDRNAQSWAPAVALEQAVKDLFVGPNLDVSADIATIRPAIDVNVVEKGWVYFKGQWSYVTPGQKTGFGLAASSDGIAFDNSQMFTSLTHVRGFNEQMARDPKGQKATKLYHFDCTTTDCAEITVHTALRASGLNIWPSYKHNANAQICAQPVAGHELQRAAAALLTMDRQKIEQKVYEGAIGPIRQNVAESAQELGTMRTREAAEERNQKLRQYLVGDDRLVFREFEIDDLKLSSNPSAVKMGGRMIWKDEPIQLGSNRPRPRSLHASVPGIAATAHLPSLLTNLSVGYFASDYLKLIENIMIETQNPEGIARPADSIKVSQNVDFNTYLKAVEKAKAANDPKVMAIRLVKPQRAPEFTTDANGNLIVLAHDFVLEVPAPAQAARGGGVTGPPANIYRLSAPEGEFAFSYSPLDASQPPPRKVTVRVVAFDPGPNAKIYAITDDETKAQALTTFSSAVIFRMVALKLNSQPISLPVDELPIQGLDLVSLAPLDASGWTQVAVRRNSERLSLRKVPSIAPPAESAASE